MNENGNGNGISATMPVQPMGYGGNYGGGWGGGYGYPVPYPVFGNFGVGGGFGDGFGGDGGWLILLLILAMGNGGWGGFGGFGGWGGMMGLGMMDGGFGAFPWILASNANNQNATNANFDTLQLGNQISGLRSDVTSGFSDTQLGIAGINQNICQSTGQIQNTLCQGFAGTTAAVTGAQNAITQQLYNNEINSLNRSFAEQTANAQGFNAAQRQLSDCCCEQRLATQALNSTIISENCADREALSGTEYRLTTLVNNGIQSIKDQMCQDKIDEKNDRISALQQQLYMKDLAASQTAQTARLLADNAAQTQQIENYVRPQINPAYIVPNPYAYNFYPGWGNNWNNGCGCGNNGFGFAN